MGLVEDARTLARRGFTPWEDSCHLTCELCGNDGAGVEGAHPHDPTCPWLSMPRIVAVLEAAERMVAAADLVLVDTVQVLPSTQVVPEDGCRICHVVLEPNGEHDPACTVPWLRDAYQALVSALAAGSVEEA